jgi:O-succinylbenzoate synthase
MYFFCSYLARTKASSDESVCGRLKLSGRFASYTALARLFPICWRLYSGNKCIHQVHYHKDVTMAMAWCNNHNILINRRTAVSEVCSTKNLLNKLEQIIWKVLNQHHLNLKVIYYSSIEHVLGVAKSHSHCYVSIYMNWAITSTAELRLFEAQSIRLPLIRINVAKIYF